jgi:glycosyltransferase involved in cell wall biosynthesis
VPVPDVIPPARRALDRLADGSPLDERLRRLFRQGAEEGALTRGPFDRDGTVAFLRWLGEADRHAEHGGLPRLLVDLHAHHDGLRSAYPDLLDPACREGLQRWVAHHGTAALGLPAGALPDLGPPAAERSPLGVNVVGYFQSEVGVGEAARRVVAGLDAARVPVLPVQGELVPTTRRGHDYGSASLDSAPFDVNLVCVNADGIPQFAAEAGARFFEGRYTIGLWWWELPTFPDRFRPAVERVDEIWVGSRYVQDAIAPAVDVPVVRVPMPVQAPRVRSRTRAELGLPDGFLVLFLFDFHSVMERKNPLGLIEAFRRAFPRPGEAQLVIKAVNGEHHEAARERLVEAVSRHPDVHLDERFVAADARDAMLASCDAYASLHRSEGFGLTIAEAMALGRPVVATGYSGPADFLDARTAWVVPHELVPVGEGHPPYDADGRWADPDLDAAAAALREIRDDPQEAARRGAHAREALHAEHSVEAAGAAMRARLEALRPAIDRRAAARVDPDLVELQDALVTARTRIGLIGGGAPPRRAPGLRRRLRRLVTGAGGAAGEDVVAADRAVLEALERAVDRLAHDLERSRVVHGTLTAATLAEQRRLTAALEAAGYTDD